MERSKRKDEDNECQRQPPDGGWGWVVVSAYAVANLLVFATMLSFTLIFKDKFDEDDLSATDVTLIINLNSGVGMGIGLFIGPLLKVFGYRRVSFIGGALFSFGFILTSWANGLFYFLATYSVMTAMGMEICIASFTLAVNTYFKAKRSKAFGVGLAIAGLGFIIFPQLVRVLLEHYGVSGTCLVVGGVSLNILAAATLLQPVKYHSKRRRPSDVMLQSDVKLQSVGLLEVYASSSSEAAEQCRITPSPHYVPLPTERPLEVPEDDSEDESDDASDTRSLPSLTAIPKVQRRSSSKRSVASHQHPPEKAGSRLVKLFDLDLLKDLRFLSLLFGSSLVMFAETNFSLLAPLMLTELHFNTAQMANYLSLLGAVDIVFRFVSPFVGDVLKLSAQAMCSLSLVATIAGRVWFMYIENYQQLLLVGIGLGIAKGFRYVYMSLVFPAYLPLDRLASASGIQTVLKGIFMIFFGPLLGLVRDYSGSYINCVTFMNLATLVTVITWTLDIILSNFNKKT